MRRTTQTPTLSRRAAMRSLLLASTAHAPLWLSCSGPASRVQAALDPLLGAAGAGDVDTSDAGPVPTAPYDPSISWYLQNEYAPTQIENDIFQLEVVGALPPELDGVYFRNGPNYRGRDLGHKFAAQGMVHAVAIRDGQALWYRNRYVRTLFYENPDELNVDPKATGANTSVVYHGSRLLAVAESGFPFELSPADLSTIGAWDFAGKLTEAFTGHPKVDPITGEMMGYGYVSIPTFLHYYRIDSAGVMQRSEPITMPLRRDGFGSKLCMMHDFAITATRTIFLQLPVVFDTDRLLRGEVVPVGWDESNGAHIGVMPRDGRSEDVVWIEIEPCWVFHVVNAYDAGPDRVILDVARHPAPFWAGDNTGLLPGSAYIARYTLDLRARTAKLNVLDDRTVEFPRIDDRLTGRAHRYAYNLEIDQTKMFEGHVTGIVKYDLERGLATKHTTAPGLHLDEVMFVPADAGEDEGYLMGFMYDRRTDRSSLVVFDAQRLSAQPIAEIKLPVRVPIGLHGYWLPSAALQRG